MARPSPESMFDPDVVREMRRQFDAADQDGSGELDASEACAAFARSCSPDASDAEVKKLADGLRNQMDADRSGTISFDEYCFRFGRRYQMEVAARRRQCSGGGEESTASAGGAEAAVAGEDEAAGARLRHEQEELAREREALRREREELARERAAAAGATGGLAGGGADEATGTTEPTPPRFAVAAHVTLQGLRGAPELNGRTARVMRFDAAAARYIVELDAGGGQKSLRPENLAPRGGGGGGRAGGGGGGRAGGGGSWASSDAAAAAPGGGFAERVKSGLCTGCAHVQVWMAGYETWQLLLGAAVAVLMVAAWLQVSSRYPGGSSGGGPGPASRSGGQAARGTSSRGSGGRSFDSSAGSGYRASPAGGYGDEGHYGGDSWDSGYDDNFGGGHSYGYDDTSAYHGGGAYGGRTADRGRRGDSYHEARGVYGDYGYGGRGHGGYGSGGSSGGLLGFLGISGQTQTLLVLAGIGFLCWKGIIPVHRMSFFQIYMLWNILQPLLLGGRGGYGGGYGGGYRRRRGFGGMGMF